MVKSHSVLEGSIYYDVTMFRTIMYSYFSVFEVTLCSLGAIISGVIGIRGYTMFKLIVIGGYRVVPGIPSSPHHQGCIHDYISGAMS